MRRPAAVAPQAAAVAGGAQALLADIAGIGARAGIAANLDEIRLVLCDTGDPVEAVAAEIHQAAAFIEVLVQPDEAMVSISCGGGGYGLPEAREPALVLRDVREGWVSRARAESVYRVVVTEGFEIDAAATSLLRRG